MFVLLQLVLYQLIIYVYILPNYPEVFLFNYVLLLIIKFSILYTQPRRKILDYYDK